MNGAKELERARPIVTTLAGIHDDDADVIDITRELAAAVAFVPLSGLVGAAIARAFGPLNGSVGYMPVVLLIVGYALALGRRAPDTARGMAAGAGILALSLGFRTVDEAACGAVPIGTHFLWHLLNATVLYLLLRAALRPQPAPAA